MGDAQARPEDCAVEHDQQFGEFGGSEHFVKAIIPQESSDSLEQAVVRCFQ